ncbi:MAG: fumarylacetoacetate hydrolase family protein [Chloroflexi bacterium]|nr:fumarylacetoacetate hydrolase family protein [Chloroflexota bacterium]
MTRFARFAANDGVIHQALVEGGQLRLIQGNILGVWEPTNEFAELAQVKLLAPLVPANILAIGLNYRAHAIETHAPIPDHPVLFIKATSSLCNPFDPIVLPKAAPSEVDYECELAIVIGKTAKHVSETHALDYVLGYTCANDVSARDLQQRIDKQWARAKSCDTFAPLGPWIETNLDPDRVAIQTRLNGIVMQKSSTSDMIFSCRQLISHLSECLTLLPGTVILTGTPPGVGTARVPQVYLHAGDVVEVEIDGIGTLQNPVITE